MADVTPMMQQYLNLKQEYPDSLLFFRLGDFYEMFFEDAKTASRELELTLTGRDCGQEVRAPMCGVPYHAVENYINKLLTKGYKVAICEQLTEPSEGKSLVERDVVRVISPGTVIEAAMLNEKQNNFIVSLYKEEERYGIAWADISTGGFYATECDMLDTVCNQLSSIRPSEVIINYAMYMAWKLIPETITGQISTVNAYDGEAYDQPVAEGTIEKHYGKPLKKLGLDKSARAVCAAGALLQYLHETQKNSLSHISAIKLEQADEYMLLDTSSRRNLELTETLRSKERKGTLLWLLDNTYTAMGGRAIRQWIEKPLLNIKRIQERQDAVEELKNNYMAREALAEGLKKIYDIERLCGKITYGSVNGRDCISLAQSLSYIPAVKEAVSGFTSQYIVKLNSQINPLTELAKLLDSAIIDNPPVSIKEGGIIRQGYHNELDSMRDTATGSKQWIAQLETGERESTGIKNLKIGYNRVFGYYIEVSKSNLDAVPYRYIRKQTLSNCERFVTPELKEMEERLLGVEDKIIRLEYLLFTQIRDKLSMHIQAIQGTATAIAQLDALLSLAIAAADNQYVKPEIHKGSQTIVKNGRHPVVEKMINGQFVPNDAILNSNDDRFVIITGPNMAGKSTYMRQVALITLMAHIGSFVPAEEATVALTDRIFTRVGASDDLSSGQSTFMVEMSELAYILKSATSKSLILLDEIGRGTSTFDGLSIAWAAVEYISQHMGSKTIFSTHYHELSELEGRLEGVKNYCIIVKEVGEDIIFLRKVRRGSADKSFGIQVAKLAGLPEAVIERSHDILTKLEAADINKNSISQSVLGSEQASTCAQVGFFDEEYLRLAECINALEIDSMTPLQALNALCEIKERAKRL